MKRFAILFFLPLVSFGVYDLCTRVAATPTTNRVIETDQLPQRNVRNAVPMPATEDRATVLASRQPETRQTTPVDALLKSLDGLNATAREELVASVIEGLVQSDAQEAARFAEAAHHPEAMDTVASLWAQHDPQSAAAWTEKQMTSRPEMVAALVSSWAQEDAHAASVWLARIPVGPGRDAGAVLLISELLESDPDSARAWIQNIGDAGMRNGMESQLATVQTNAQSQMSADATVN